MKLFVWQDVLRDYTTGMAVVFAKDEKEARKIMERDFPDYITEQLSFTACEVVTKPKAFYVYGGG